MKRIIRLLFPLLLLLPCYAQVPVAPAVIPHVTFVDASGGPCASCQFYSYAAGTTTPLATYTDSAGVSQNTNPIILDAAGGANIWLANNSYKLILKDASGTTIWTVDNVKGGGGLGGVCGPSGAIQIANSGVNGLTCDSQITINTTNHTLNVGTLPANYVTIGALGTPTSWNFDTTTPATALASLGGGTDFGIFPGGVTTDNSGWPVTPGEVRSQEFRGVQADIAEMHMSDMSSFTGNFSTSVTTPHVIGNSDTATQLAGSPTQCAGGQSPTGIAANGNAICVNGPIGNRICNSNGCYIQFSDGTIEEWGTVPGCASSGSTDCSVTATFPIPYTTFVVVQGTCIGPANCGLTFSSPGVTSFTAQFVGLVMIGGGGGNMTGSQFAYWHAIGY